MFPRIKLTLACVFILVLSMAGLASAETWICSVQEVIESADDGTVGPPDFGAVSPATFFHVDTGRKRITLLAPADRRGETTEIMAQKADAEGWFLSGVENSRAWSMVISSDGNVTLAITMEGASWTAFGKAIPASQVKPD